MTKVTSATGGRLRDRAAVITGAASGIGAATARRFVEEGAHVVLGDIQEPALTALARDLGAGAVGARCDVTQETEVAALVDLAVSRFGRLDVMVNNAGIVGAVGPVDSIPASEWRATMAVLLDGVFFGIKHAVRVMKPQGSGSIISLASVAGLMGGLGPHPYAAAKHAVIGLTKNAAAELAGYGIRVNAVAPGSLATPMVAALRTGDPVATEAVRQSLAEESPLKGRAGLPEDVANAILWLASDEAGYTTGHTLAVDAGITIGSGNPGQRYAERAPMVREAGRRGL